METCVDYFWVMCLEINILLNWFFYVQMMRFHDATNTRIVNVKVSPPVVNVIFL